MMTTSEDVYSRGFSEFQSPVRADPMRVSDMGPAPWPAGLPEKNKWALQATPGAEGQFWRENGTLTSRMKGEEKQKTENMFQLSHRQSKAKWQHKPTRPSSPSVKHASSAAPI